MIIFFRQIEHLKNELKSLGEEECNLAKKLELRKKQCHNLITSIKQMKNTLELGMLLFCSNSFNYLIVYIGLPRVRLSHFFRKI